MPDSLNVQNRLNLILPLKAGASLPLKAQIAGLMALPVNPLHVALKSLRNVHFAQFVLLENETRLGVFTIYDGDFDDYILSFTQHVGGIFDMILQFVEGGDAVRPVQQRRDAFLEFIRQHDIKGLEPFNAYPNQRLFDIQDALAGVKR